MAHPERILPTETSTGIVALHLKRYEFALQWCCAADVLDAGCGVGYGTAFIARQARRVVGVDRDEEAIAVAKARYAAPNATYVQSDVLDLPFADASFDVVCAFETIEHLADPRRFVAEAGRVLRPEGTLLASTPRVTRTTHTPENPFHRIEFSPTDFERLLREEFDDVALYGQRRLQTRRHRLAQRLDFLGLRRRFRPPELVGRMLGTPTTAYVGLDEIVIDRDLERARELVGVCTRARG
jgi:SAM-dependent methyltransferase